MSYEPPGFNKNSIYSHGKVYESTTKVGSALASFEKPVANGASRYLSRHDERKHKRNYKLLIDPALKKGSEKIFRFDGEFPGQPPIVPKDPRSRRTRIWTLNKADLPVPNFKYDKYYVGIPPQREVVFTGLNDNVDKKFLQEMCQKYGKVEHIKIYYDPLTKKHAGKARVIFDLTKSAKLACSKLNSCSVMGNIITTQLEPNLKGINARQKLQKGTEKPHNKEPHYPQSSKPSLHFPTPPSTNSHSPSVESSLSTPCTPKLSRPADPRLRMITPTTPPLQELSSLSSSFQKSYSSQLSHSGHGSVFSSSLSSSSFEPISPPPAPVKEKVLQDTPVEGAPPLPPPVSTTASFLGYEDISPEQPPTPDATKKSFSTSIKSSEPKSSEESKITKMIKSLRKDSSRHSPGREHSRSPKTDKYSQDYGSHEQRHYDDNRDKHRDRYYNRDYQDDKDYSSRRDSKRSDRYSDHRSGYSQHYDSRKESSYSDYKSRKTEYSRSSYRDDYDKRKRSDKRSDRYSTSPRRPEDRDRYASSPHRSEERRSDSYNKDEGKWRGGRSPNDGETFPYTSSRAKRLQSVSPGKSGKSPVTSHSRKGPVSPVDSPNGRTNTVYRTTTRHDTSSYSKKPSTPVETDRLRTKQVVRKRKLSDSTDDSEDNNFKSKRTNIKKHELENDHERYSPELFDESKNQNESSQNKLDDLPQVVDISPCPSPQGTMTVNAEVRSSEEPSSLYSDIETTDDAVTTDDKNDQDDDAMSLSSISSNEDTFELNEPSKKISPQPKPMTVPPPNMVFSFPPPMIPPPPMIFNPHVPPPGIPFPPPQCLPPPLPGTLPPPHIPPPGITGVPPIPPPIPHPNVMHPIVPGTSYSTSYQHSMGGYLSQGFEYKPSKQEQYWNWKRQIIEVVSKTIHNELDAVLSRDVLRKLVELSAFKSLDAWWENQKKPKSAPAVSSSQNTATVGQPSSSTLLGPSPFDRPHNMALGFRTSLSFRRRIPEVKPEVKKAESLQKVVGEKSLSLGIPKKRQVDDSETDRDHEVEGATHEKRVRTVSSITEDTDDDRSQSPWQHLDDSMEAAPPATDVRVTKAADRRVSTGSSLYKTIYSSESESEEESEGKDESEDEQEQEDESSEEEVSSEDETDEEESEESEEEEEEEEEQEEEVQNKKLEHVDEENIKDETLKDVIEEDLEVDMSSTNEDSLVEKEQENLEDVTLKSTVETVTISQTTNFDSSTTVPLLPVSTKHIDENKEDSSLSSEIASDIEPEMPQVPVTANEKVKEEEKEEVFTKPDELEDKKLDQEVKDITETQEKEEKRSIVSLVELDHSYGLARKEATPPIDVVSLETPEKKPTTVEEVVKPVVEKKPEVKEEPLLPVRKHLFSARTFEQDDELVYEFLKSGLDYEDACFLKVGFDQLNQVCSESVIGAKWSYHPVTAQQTNTAVPKRRRQKQDLGLRQHATGCARSEGYYKIDKKEKLRFAESAHKQVLEEKNVAALEEPKLDASKGKQLSRENRAMQRRLQSAVCNEDFADILKFNKLMVRKKQLKFAKSPIHDWGLVALEPIAADEMVIEYVGEMIRQIIADTRERHYEEHGIGSSYMFRLDEDTIIDATTKGNNARFINHCCEPNCYAKVIAMESEKKIVIYSKRDIQVNEEITYDYKFPLEDEKIPCLCGAAHCRGTLN